MKNKTALLVIDMQNDFVKEGGTIEVKGIRNNMSKFKEFISKCKENNISVIYTKHIFDPEHNIIESRLFPSLAEEGLRDNTEGTEIYHELKPEKNDIIIKKRRYDAFLGTDLELILRSKGIKNLIITGTMTNVCCESTARTAMMKDFHVLFCSDLTYTSDPEIHKNTLKNISSHFGTIWTSEEIFSLS